jgi:hypothetical protein
MGMNKEVYYPDSDRIGMLLILYETLRDERELVGALVALGTIISCEDHESGRGKVFTLACEHFQRLAEGEEIPEYRVEFVYDQPFADPEWEAKRVNSGKFGFAFFRKIIVRAPPLEIGASARAAVLH